MNGDRGARTDRGLWLGLRWAEYLTAGATASFVPIELYEVLQRFTLLRVGAMVLNVAAAAYLAYRLRPSPKWGTNEVQALAT